MSNTRRTQKKLRRLRREAIEAAQMMGTPFGEKWKTVLVEAAKKGVSQAGLERLREKIKRATFVQRYGSLQPRKSIFDEFFAAATLREKDR